MTKLHAAIHSLLAFSASPRWIPCPGSMAYPGNQSQDSDGGFYANEGTAAHELAARYLKDKQDGSPSYVGTKIKAGKDEIEVTEEFADYVMVYTNDVENRALGGYMFIEQRVTLAGVEGFDESNYGTSDCIIAMPAGEPRGLDTPAYGVVVDLKFGMGERVYAWEHATDGAPFTMEMYTDTGSYPVVPNYQLMMYALAALQDIRMMVDEPAFVRLVINQPRIGNLSELDVPIAVLERFALFAAEAKVLAESAMKLGWDEEIVQSAMLNPGQKQCRWCKAFGVCKVAAHKVAEEVGADFDDVSEVPPVVSNSPVAIAKAMKAIPFIRDWIKAVDSQANQMVSSGITVLGTDGKPMKFVEGDLGDRKWKDPVAAEAALVGLLGEKAHVKKLLTAPAAAKLLDKAKTKQAWKDVFEPNIGRAPGKPILVNGSDSRPEYSNANAGDDFEAVE